MPLTFKGKPIASILFNNKPVKFFNFGAKSWSSFNDGCFTFTPIKDTWACSVQFKKSLFNQLSTYYKGNLDIPGKVTDNNGIEYSVIKIDDRGFANTRITGVTIPKSIKFIGKEAFKDCSNLETITFEKGSQLRYLNSSSFAGCTKLSKVNLQEATKLKQIGAGAFNGCMNLIAVQLPQAVTKISNQAFYNCKSLTYITVPDKVRLIGTEAFSNCSSLKAIHILGNTRVSGGAFNNCANATIYFNCIGALNKEITGNTQQWANNWGVTETQINTTLKVFIFESAKVDGKTGYQIIRYNIVPGLNTIAIPEVYQGTSEETTPIIAIGEGAFENCSAISKIIIPTSITSIANRAFKGCTSLTEIDWGGSIQSIGEEAFSGCSNLTSGNLPDSITSIGSQAFYGCSKLSTIEIPYRVTNIGAQAFAESNNLQVNLHLVQNSDIPFSTEALAGCSANWLVSVKGEYAGLNYLKYYDNTIKITSGSGCSGEVVIPETIDGYTNTSIGSNAFANNTDIISVTIPNTVTSLGAYAFSNCKSLNTVVLGDGLTCIEPYTFSGCLALENLAFGSNITSIKEYAFGSNNTDVSKPVNINIKNMTNWCEMTLGNIYSAPLNKFNNKSHYISLNENSVKSLSIPNDVIEVCNRAFYKCTDLSEIVLGDSVFSIGALAFNQCSQLSKVEMNGNITYIGKNAFSPYNNEQGRIVEIPSISNWLNINMARNSSPLSQPQDRIYLKGESESITSIEIPGDVTEIKAGVLDYWQVNNLKIGNHITSISKDALKFLYTASIEADSENTYYKSIDGVLYSFDGAILIKYPVLKEPTDNWFNIPNTVEFVQDYAFYGCTTLSKISAYDNTLLTSIGASAFAKCANLEEIILLAETTTLKSIGAKAFEGCTSITEVAISDSVTDISDYAFYGCNNLETVTLSKELKLISKSLFSHCINLASITFGGQEKSIQANAFYECSSLTSIVIPDSITNIGDYAFHLCSKLTQIYYTSSVSDWNNITIGSNNNCLKNATHYYYSEEEPTEEGNFWHWGENGEVVVWEPYTPSCYVKLKFTSTGNGTCSVTGVEDCIGTDVIITIPTYSSNDGYLVTSIGDLAFSGLSNIIHVVIPDSVTSIGNGAFASCDSLVSVTIPDGVTSIGESAFRDCFSLTNVVIGDSVEVIDNYAFWGCDSLEYVVIGNSTDGYSLKTIGDYAFRGCSSLNKIYRHQSPDQSDPQIEISENTFEGCPNKQGLLADLGLLEDEGITTTKHCDWCSSDIDLRQIDGLFLCEECAEEYENETEGEDDESTLIAVIAGGVSGFLFFLGAAAAIAWFFTKATVLATLGLLALAAVGAAGVFALVFNLTKALIDASKPEDQMSVSNMPALALATTIGIGGIRGWKGSRVVLPNNIINIESQAFASCPNLTEVVVPLSVSNIQNEAFIDCPNLIIKCEAASKPDTWDDNWNPDNRPVVWNCNKNATSHNYFSYSQPFSDGSVAITAATKDLPSKINIPTTSPQGRRVSAIASYAFAKCTNITHVTIPEGVLSIGNSAFSECTNLIDINLPESLISIGIDAFYLCQNLYTISIPKSVTSISKLAFRDCASLSNIFIPSSVTELGAGAFLCAAARDLTIYCEASEKPSGWSSNWNITTVLDLLVPDDTWDGTYFDIVWNCLAPMSDDYFSYTLQDDGTYAVGAIKTDGINQTWPVLSIPSTYNGKPVTAIADSGFSNCSSLSKIVIPDSVQSIGQSAFQSCINLKSIILPPNLTKIGFAAFMFCRDLQSIKIPDSVNNNYSMTSLFSGCSSLVDVKLPQHWTKIHAHMFSDCTNLEVIILPSSTSWIDTGAFSGCTSLQCAYLRYPIWRTSSNEDIDLTNKSASDIATYLVNDLADKYLLAKAFKAPVMNADLKLASDSLSLDVTIENTNHQSCPMTIEITLLNNSSVANTGSEDLMLPSMGQAKFSTNINIPLKDENNTVINFNKIELKAYFETGDETKILFDIDNNFAYTLISHEDYSIKAIDPSKISEQELLIPPLCSEGYITAIGDNAFKGAAITRVILHNNITSIGKNAFSNTWLEDIHIPLSVIHVGADAFSGTTNLTVCCDAYSCPDTWAKNWDTDVKEVVWRYSCTGEHSYGGSETVLPTCENKGYTVQYCSKCNYAHYDNYVNAYGHFYESVRTEDPTCTASGYTVRTCLNCGSTIHDNIVKPLGHDESRWINTGRPTGCHGGSRFKYCNRCDKTVVYEHLPMIQDADEYLQYTLLDSGDAYSVKPIYLDDVPSTLLIPRTFKDKPITIVDFEAFASFRQDYKTEVPVTKVILFDSIKAILEDAFAGCTMLREINIPASVEYIEIDAFSDCPNLTIYCEASSKPEGWDDNWNDGSATVVWGTSAEYLVTEDNDILTDEQGNSLILKEVVLQAVKDPIIIYNGCEGENEMYHDFTIYNDNNFEVTCIWSGGEFNEGSSSTKIAAYGSYNTVVSSYSSDADFQAQFVHSIAVSGVVSGNYR